ncbi:hydrogenase expression/formation protein HypE [Clostridium algifaecis]|uniref:Hydrogenase expression/formation protein HypE n=1 Tax=Clostridium algifaecis TaxID=1472040 RepID=A0ABS4KNT4_9CLOT|nr:hydrogenase expression/formation protein HypE [Clostridium algifaecis]MBP2031702.1 hydrogenase expression/formation protein HypE [Clostridium algifaecis]
MEETIKLVYGDGGKYTNELIKEIIYKCFNNVILTSGIDSAVFSVKHGKAAFTTDSFVVKPLFFPGGDIGKLAICGTINDLSVSGAKPIYLSCSFIIEEGFPTKAFELIVKSMAEQCKKSNVKVVTGDTKVVEKGGVDGIFINTSGVGTIEKNYEIKPIESGDRIIVSGNIGEHGTTIALERYKIKVKGDFKSDCASVYKITSMIKEYYPFIKIMKDPTRGGIATIINELSSIAGLSVKLTDGSIPISREIEGINKILGLDPLYMACEGRLVLVVKSNMADEVLQKMKKLEQCRNAKIIGVFTDEQYPMAYIENSFGGKRILNTLDQQMLPRIC